MRRLDKNIPFVPTSIALGLLAAMVSMPKEAGAQELEEIIVTARKRTQSVQDVPMHLQAFDQDMMRERMLRGFEDYAKDLTSVTFGTSGPGASTIAFRGTVSQPSGFDGISSSILYLDEIPITRDGQNPDVRLYDMERLEALSGPQPTLYGAGSQSGTLKIVTNKPNTEETGGWVMAEGGYLEEGESSYNLSGALNWVISPGTLAVRLVGFYEHEGGYIDNVLGTTGDYSPDNGSGNNANQVEDDVNDWTAQGGRLMVRWQPNDNWIVDLGYIYQKSEVDGLFDFNPQFGDLNTVKFKDEKRDDEWYNISLTIQGDLGWADLTIAGGSHNRKIDYEFDSTAYMTTYKENGLDLAEYYTGVRQFPSYEECAAAYICFIGYNDFGPDPTGTIFLEQEVESFAQEIRLASKDDGSNKFNWLVGAFYENTDNDYDYLSFVDDFAENGLNGGYFAYYGVEPTNDWFDQGFRAGQTYNGLPGNSFNGFIQSLESIAVFGEVSYRFTDNLSLSAGGRWFETEFSVEENSLFVGQPDDNFSVEETTSDFNPKVTLTWLPTDDSLIYATYSEGVRIGGANGGVSQNPGSIAIGAPEVYEPDILKNYEIGFKATWMEGALITNLTAFTMDWEDYQILSDLPIAGPTTVNAGSASIDGAEGSVAYAFGGGFEISAAATYLDARIDDDIILNDGAITAAEKGDPLPVVPEWKVAASLQYSSELPWNGLIGTARFDYNYVGESVNGTNASVALFGVGATEIQTQPSYELGALYFELASATGAWTAWLGVSNLWDERAVTFIWPRFSDNRQFTVRPREISAGMYYSF
ncbi:MAG: TonB-dependent receptor [Pseudomonadota bacterium]